MSHQHISTKAKTGPRGEPMATPSKWFWQVFETGRVRTYVTVIDRFIAHGSKIRSCSL